MIFITTICPGCGRGAFIKNVGENVCGVSDCKRVFYVEKAEFDAKMVVELTREVTGLRAKIAAMRQARPKERVLHAYADYWILV